MPIDPKNPYSPPGVYTETNFETNVSTSLSNPNIPVLIGPGNETLTANIEVVRGSSSTADQRIVLEDASGRAVMEDGSLGDWNASARFLKVRNFPIVTGEGSGTTTEKSSDVVALINNEPIVVLSVDGENGLVELATSPKSDDEVRISYFFNRTDTALTDDLSDQVSGDSAELIGGVGGPFAIDSSSDSFLVSVNGGAEVEIVIEASADTYTAAQVALEINAAGVGITADTTTNNEGATVLTLSADQSISIGVGTMNAVLGFTAGQSTSRNAVFYAKQVPIVTGDNSGTTTTEAGDVSVTVDGNAVEVAAVDGANGAITLAVAPPAGSVVSVSYFWNSFQDTFDYLANIGVTDVLSCGISRGVKSYIEGTDFILKDDKLYWGTAFNLAAGQATEGAVEFGESQITGQLIDDKSFFLECSPVTDTSVVPASMSSTTFRLPYVPTTGNGIGNEITASQFKVVANSRRDLATNRPELVKAYWGYDVQDAMDRGPVTVARVDGANAKVTLVEAVPPGARVYATFYHSRMADTGNSNYTIACTLAGSSGTGTYTVTNPDGQLVPITTYAGKGVTLVDEVMMPSGSETQPRAYHSGGVPVEEDVTISFVDRDPTPAEWSLTGIGPFYFVDGSSDELELTVGGGGVAGDWNGTVDLTDAFMATLVGDKVDYDADSDDTSWLLDNDETITLDVDGQSIEATVTAAAGLDLSDFVDAINAAAVGVVPVAYSGAGKFSSLTVAGGQHDACNLRYRTQAGATDIAVTLNNGEVCATPAAIAAHVEAQIQAAVDAAFMVADDRPSITVSTNAQGQMVIGFAKAVNDDAGTLQFRGDANDGGNFWVLAGVDCASDADGATTLVDGNIALRAGVAGTAFGGSGSFLNDRIVLRNRIQPRGASVHPSNINSQVGVTVQSGTNLGRLGLQVGDKGQAACSACVIPASIAGDVQWKDGQDGATSQPVVVFFDGTEAGNPQNDTLSFNIDGSPVSVVFTSSGAGTNTPLGPIGQAGSVMRQIAEAIATQVDDYAAWTNVRDAGVVAQDGNILRLNSATGASSSAVVISDEGSAQDVLGLEGSASREAVAADLLVGAINQAGATETEIQSLNAAAEIDFTGGFAETDAATYGGWAQVQVDGGGSRTVFLTTQGLGTAAAIAVDGGNALRPGSRLLNSAGDGAVGEAGRSGFVVSSSNPNGSGSADDSILSSGGAGSDGVVGQTYKDSVTGLTFTILPRDGGGNYTSDATSTYSMEVRFEGTADANNPVTAIPGLWTWVANTAGVAEGDTAEVETFKASAAEAEPANGQSYFVSYVFAKRDFSTRAFTRLATMERAFGSVGPDSPTSLAAYLMMLNGGGAVGVKQVKRAEGSTNASEASYLDAIEELEGLLPGGIRPAVLLPLTPASLELATYLSTHCTVQSDITHRAERTAILGFQAGTQPNEAANLVNSLNGGQGDMRIRFVYPDMMTVTTTDALGNDTESLIDGRYLATMMGARQLSANRDVATPWTGTRLVGTNGLARQLDAVSQNQVAAAGVSVCENRGGLISVRHGLTSDMSDVLTKTPTVVQIIDEVQQQARGTLASYVGVKFLPSVLSQIEGRISMMFGRMIDAQIISSYTGVKASISPDDPTMANMEAYYQPVFPLLYIVLSFNLRSQL